MGKELDTPSYTAHVAVETDYEYFAMFGNTTDALDYLGDLCAYGSVQPHAGWPLELDSKEITGRVLKTEFSPSSDFVMCLMESGNARHPFVLVVWSVPDGQIVLAPRHPVPLGDVSDGLRRGNVC